MEFQIIKIVCKYWEYLGTLPRNWKPSEGGCMHNGGK